MSLREKLGPKLLRKSADAPRSAPATLDVGGHVAIRPSEPAALRGEFKQAVFLDRSCGSAWGRVLEALRMLVFAGGAQLAIHGTVVGFSSSAHLGRRI